MNPEQQQEITVLKTQLRQIALRLENLEEPSTPRKGTHSGKGPVNVPYQCPYVSTFQDHERRITRQELLLYFITVLSAVNVLGFRVFDTISLLPWHP